MKRELSECQLIERSIQKKYRKELWRPFTEAIKRYALIEEGDKIAVCISGGKDSMLLAKMFQLLRRITDFPFDVEYMVMDPGYNEANRRKIEENAALMEIPVKIFETDIFDVAESVPKSPCYLCARMRRGHLYSQARALGCNKIALGHHFNDVIETTLMGMLHGAQIQGMRPKLLSTNFRGMELIRPLYLVHEDAIKAWRDYNHLEFLQCACHFTEQAAAEEVSSKRQETKELISFLKKTNPLIETNIFNSIHDVNVDTLVGYKTRGVLHSFLDEFEDEKRRRTFIRYYKEPCKLCAFDPTLPSMDNSEKILDIRDLPRDFVPMAYQQRENGLSFVAENIPDGIKPDIVIEDKTAFVLSDKFTNDCFSWFGTDSLMAYPSDEGDDLMLADSRKTEAIIKNLKENGFTVEEMP